MLNFLLNRLQLSDDFIDLCIKILIFLLFSTFRSPLTLYPYNEVRFVFYGKFHAVYSVLQIFLKYFVFVQTNITLKNRSPAVSIGSGCQRIFNICICNILILCLFIARQSGKSDLPNCNAICC